MMYNWALASVITLAVVGIVVGVIELVYWIKNKKIGGQK